VIHPLAFLSTIWDLVKKTTAPGSDILSTTAIGKGGLTWLEISSSGAEFSLRLMELSPVPRRSVGSGQILLCPNLGQSICRGNGGGHICLIERGTITFEEKGIACQQGGGIAAIIFNNVEEESLNGKLADNTQVTIPVTGVSKEIGLSLLYDHEGESGTIGFIDGYTYNSGTSMVCMHCVARQ